MRRLRFFLTFTALLFTSSGAFSQDANFYIFLAFGQSNMEGSVPFEATRHYFGG